MADPYEAEKIRTKLQVEDPSNDDLELSSRPQCAMLIKCVTEASTTGPLSPTELLISKIFRWQITAMDNFISDEAAMHFAAIIKLGPGC